MTATTPLSPTLDVSRTERVPFRRLVLVEWRKMTDTRSGFWLLLVTGLLLVAAVALTLLVVALEDVPVMAQGLAQVMSIPVSLLLPVFPILIVTSEWAQRSALVTFALEPHRLRVVLAKLVAVTALAAVTIAVAVMLGAVANVACAAVNGLDATWDLSVADLLWLLVGQLLYFFMAFGLGMLLLNAPGAIALFYVDALLLPFMVWGALYQFFDWGRTLVPMVDLNFALMPFTEERDIRGVPFDVGADDVLALASAVTLWVVLPVALGGWRMLRKELK